MNIDQYNSFTELIEKNPKIRNQQAAICFEILDKNNELIHSFKERIAIGLDANRLPLHLKNIEKEWNKKYNSYFHNNEYFQARVMILSIDISYVGSVLIKFNPHKLTLGYKELCIL